MADHGNADADSVEGDIDKMQLSQQHKIFSEWSGALRDARVVVTLHVRSRSRAFRLHRAKKRNHRGRYRVSVFQHGNGGGAVWLDRFATGVGTSRAVL
jgi:hypothetical protein